MNASAAGASAGALGAAAAHQKLIADEEEEMTPYSDRDLAEDWEFKILRSLWGSFGDPEYFRQALAEESRAGWVMVEKFDNHRIRLKRLASASRGDEKLDFDPYRSYAPNDWRSLLSRWTGLFA